MGLGIPCENPGEPRVHEVYGSSSRLAFSRYFVVSHVDGFIYVLDKYFCISRLVPPRSKDCSLPSSSCAQQVPQGASEQSSERAPSHFEASVQGASHNGRHPSSEHWNGGEYGYILSTEAARSHSGNLLVPVRIADVFSALFRTNKPVFSQLLTGNDQYDQRQLQKLRQRSLLLSNKRDGCLYLFLKKFLLRVSLRGTVSVVADLLQLALAAAGRLCPDGSAVLSTSTPAARVAQPQSDDSEQIDDCPNGTPTLMRVDSLRRLWKSMGYDENDSALGNPESSAHPRTFSQLCRGPQPSMRRDEMPLSTAAQSQSWQKSWLPRERVRSIGMELPTVDGSTERLQEFLMSQGEDWEVNNCCMDGEGRCYYTVTHSKSSCPLQQRGMIFCLDAQGAVLRARVLRFSRGVSAEAVLSLSLSAHPITGCYLVVAKSASSVRERIFSPVDHPLFFEDTQSRVATSADEGWSKRQDVSKSVTKLETAKSSTTSEARPFGVQSQAALDGSEDSSVTPSDTPAVRQLSDGSSQSLTASGSEGTPTVHETRDGADDYVARETLLEGRRTGSSTEEPQEQLFGSASLRESLGGRQQAGALDTDTQIYRQHSSEGVGNGTASYDHSTWWFCPSKENPSFYFPVSEYLHDEALHSVAQSVCRQFRGSPNTSVCRAYFGDNCNLAVSEALAAATAACNADQLASIAKEAASASSSCKRSVGHNSLAAAARALEEAARAAARAESAGFTGYILWQPGVKVKRPKTGEEAISFGSAILIHARTKSWSRQQRSSCTDAETCWPPRALESITEAVAVVGQDARHLEVRDALPSPLGFIVVPAEAANRIVKQRHDDSSGAIASSNAVSLTSFLSSFLLGSPTAVHSRGDPAGEASSAGNAGSEDSRQLVPERPGTSPDFATAGSTAVSAAVINPTKENSQKAVPAVNIVFLVDTLRICRFAKANSSSGTSQQLGHIWNSDESGSSRKRDEQPMGFIDSARNRSALRPSFERFDCRDRARIGGGHTFAFDQDGRLSGSNLRLPAECGQRCSCKREHRSLETSRVSVLHSRFSDVLLRCADGVEIPSHRALLAARCSFFEAKLTHARWEAHGSDKVVIDLREFPGSVVQATVSFFETGSFVIPATCCCPDCCVEKQLDLEERKMQGRTTPYEAHCSCRVDWVLQAFTFAEYCLIHDLQSELLAALARLLSQRTCLRVLTHPAVRNQRQILQLAAHQLVYHMPMPNLLLEADGGQTDASRKKPLEENSPKDHPESPGQPQSFEKSPSRESGRRPLLPLLLSEGIYDVVVTALCAWVLDSGQNAVFFSKLQLIPCAHSAAPVLRARQLLVLLALRLLQESIIAPSSCAGKGSSNGNSTGEVRSTASVCASSPSREKTWLLVPLRKFPDEVRYFVFRDVVLLWAKMLQVPEQDAKAVAQGAEDLGLP